MPVFNRGLHCSAGQAQLRELERRLDALQERGLAVASVSAETEARATRMRDEWGVRRVRSPTD